MRLPPLPAVIVAVLAGSVLAAPAEATSPPAQVGLVSITHAQTYVAGGTTRARIRIAWPAAKRATRYQVFVARTKAKVAAQRTPVKTVRKPRAWIPDLKRDTTYWFQVRAINGSRVGPRSARVARVTPIAQASLSLATHPRYSLMSYNVCSNACEKKRPWAKRERHVVDQILQVRPDVVAVQEASRWTAARIRGYTEALGGRDNRIFYRDAVFEQVEQEVDPAATAACRTATGPPTEPCVLPVDGITTPPGKAAPWVMLRHRRSGQQVVFVGIHLQVGDSDATARLRARQMTAIIAGLREQLAWWGHDLERVPVALIGDFNTNRSRSNNAVFEKVMRQHGFWDAYEQAHRIVRQHQNTANPNWQWRVPGIGVTWGDHVDKVWVRPGRSMVKLWKNAARMNGDRYATPLPSDHHPLLVRAQLS